MNSLLHQGPDNSRSDNSPKPLIAQFLHIRPEGVLVLPVALEISMLLLAAHTVATLLVGLGGFVATDVAEEGVIGEGADDLDGGEHVGCVEQEREGEVD